MNDTVDTASATAATPVTAFAPRKVANYPEYVAVVDELFSTAGEPLWYRGVGRVAYKLIPSIYRPHKRAPEFVTDWAYEKAMHDLFIQRSLPYISPRTDDYWEHMFIMQHYGLPTRLLDWTESPLLALFFALADAPYDVSKDEYVESCFVHVLRPKSWNETVIGPREGGNTKKVCGTDDADTGRYKILDPTGISARYPLAIIGMHNNPRIAAQKGVFTIFGNESASMENVHVSLGMPQEVLTILEVPAAAIATTFKSLMANGIGDASVFPELYGLAREIKRHYGFRV